MKKASHLLILLSFTLNFSYGQTLRAMADTFTVWQANIDTLRVTSNDIISASDSACITLVNGSIAFSMLNCKSIIYRPDSTFTGLDSCVYALCDTAGNCDTARVFIYVDTNRSLLPMASFIEDTTVEFDHLFFNSHGCSWYGYRYKLINKSANSDSIVWTIRSRSCNDSIKYFFTDTIHFSPSTLWQLDYCDLGFLSISLTAYNKFGATTICDTTNCLYFDGINETKENHVVISPNPANDVLRIKLDQNNQAISGAFLISIYDIWGQEVYTALKTPNNSNISMDVNGLPEGIYSAAIQQMELHKSVSFRFVISH